MKSSDAESHRGERKRSVACNGVKKIAHKSFCLFYSGYVSVNTIEDKPEIGQNNTRKHTSEVIDGKKNRSDKNNYP